MVNDYGNQQQGARSEQGKKSVQGITGRGMKAEWMPAMCEGQRRISEIHVNVWCWFIEIKKREKTGASGLGIRFTISVQVVISGM